jgi:glucosyl-dolichyl phosphate glucuronosyltransferase
MAEAIVVDNASTDNTPTVVRNTILRNMQLVYLFNPRRGKSNALNFGLARARGETLFFIDDDVAPCEDWIEQILACFLLTHCDAAVGKVTLAPHLERTWMRRIERAFLADLEFESGAPIEFVGANAAVHRSVFERVPAFDPELGPGALGLGEDTLFGWQMIDAGFKIQYASKAVVVHQPDKLRLSRGGWLNAATQFGSSKAYLLHHWEHVEIRAARAKWLWLCLKLTLRRLVQRPPPLKSEGCPPWELSYVYNSAMLRRYCIERLRPRKYPNRLQSPGISFLGPNRKVNAIHGNIAEVRSASES